ncbi:MAG: S41 family peptidase [Candidatus Eiseniibacteriota bacterium]|nr:MAG: S41 family peptidase [Candidatus Eisenbacteria bacterium]
MARGSRHSLVIVLVIVLVAAGWFAGRVQATGDNAYRLFSQFMDVVAKVRDNYVEEVNVDNLIEDAIRGMLRDLDPHSQYLSSADYTSLKIDTHGSYGGLGIVIGVRDGFLTVVSPMEGTPASRMGLRSLDRVVEIDGESTDGMTLDEAVSKMRGPEGTNVVLTVLREGIEKPLEFDLTREVIEVKSIPYSFATADSIGFVRVSRFSETTPVSLENVLVELERQGIRGLIVDLRRNPGGLLGEAVSVAESFVPKDSLVVYTRGRVRMQNANYYSKSVRVHDDYPIVVLIDGGSASASEIVAGAIQDLDLGVLVGERTFGKGSVQSVFPLRNGAALKLTTATYYTPSGRCIHAESQRRRVRSSADIKIGPPEEEEEERPEFRTSGGRIVYGGGGVTPDVEIKYPTLSAIAERLERGLLFYKFAVDFIEGDGQLTADGFEVFPAVVDDFADFLAEQDFAYGEAEFRDDLEYIERAIKREVVGELAGDEAQFKVYIQGDPQVQAALDMLRQSRSKQELFQVAEAMSASTESSSAPPSRAEAPAKQ